MVVASHLTLIHHSFQFPLAFSTGSFMFYHLRHSISIFLFYPFLPTSHYNHLYASLLSPCLWSSTVLLFTGSTLFNRFRRCLLLPVHVFLSSNALFELSTQNCFAVSHQPVCMILRVSLIITDGQTKIFSYIVIILFSNFFTSESFCIQLSKWLQATIE